LTSRVSLDIPIERLRRAAGLPEPGTPFHLPDYAARLSAAERSAIEHIVRVMVEAKDHRQHGTILRAADPYMQRPEAEENPTGEAATEDAEDELAARRAQPHRPRRPGLDPEWDLLYSDMRAASEGDPDVGMDEIPDDST
jgi:hypothetical protein